MQQRRSIFQRGDRVDVPDLVEQGFLEGARRAKAFKDPLRSRSKRHQRFNFLDNDCHSGRC
jgi:hypothetical protein